MRRIPPMEVKLLCGSLSHFWGKVMNRMQNEQLTLKYGSMSKVIIHNTPSLSGEYLYQVWEGSLHWKESYCTDTISLSNMALSWADDLEDTGQGQRLLHHNTPSLSGEYLYQVWKGFLQWKKSYGADIFFIYRQMDGQSETSILPSIS